METGENKISWQANDRLEKERKVDWYWAVILIAIAGAVLCFLFGNFLLGVFIILATILIFFFASQKPKEREYVLDEKGLHFSGHTIPLEKIKAFWLEETENHNKLFIETDDAVTPITSFLYDKLETGDAIYEFLIQTIEEKPMVEPISQQIFEKLGF